MPTTLQPLRWHAFHLPKNGHSAEEYEDAFAANPERGRFAVADGASESSFAGSWAELLVEGFVHEARRPWEDTAWLDPLRQRWAAEVGNKPLPWYAEMKRDDGAFATFLGFSLRPDKRWRALAVGDSCLIQIRAGQLVTSFPIKQADEFGNQPNLIGSRRRPGSAARLPVKVAIGAWQPSDYFLLMTDALAQWFLKQTELKQRPWDRLAPLLTVQDAAAGFATLVAQLRTGGELRNDDVTLLLTEPPSEVAAPAQPRRKDTKLKG